MTSHPLVDVIGCALAALLLIIAATLLSSCCHCPAVEATSTPGAGPPIDCDRVNPSEFEFWCGGGP
jgi:hypothetical protein